CQQANTLPYTF
nr:immunoglobulin light chain junction region [Mus musculus]NSL99673.1 immunoglobulin light chain junction region [Mus musculus]NSM00750.1 immunoglobulin light chain junction region [Mus musculus]NSM01302.1 immunoglobulin light chain junction region [Mus musculus]NSM02542.1 immunoglobulin light chain junction region [Mus musculus]